jgi:hypothetical protein
LTKITRAISLGFTLLVLLGMSGCFGLGGQNALTAATSTPTEGAVEATPEPEATATMAEEVAPASEAAPVTPSLTPLPSPTPLSDETPAGETPEGEPVEPVGDTPIPPGTEPLEGLFDVYLLAPDESGTQSLRWVSVVSDRVITEIHIRSADHRAIRAGQYIYFVQADTFSPRRVNTAGAIEELTFANPRSPVVSYQMLPSSTGDYLAWLEVDQDGSYTISAASSSGEDARVVSEGTLGAGETIKLMRVARDGSKLFFDRRPADVSMDAAFDGYYDLYQLNLSTGEEAQLPGEPACGGLRVCGAHISPDGAYLARTLPPTVVGAEVVVTNLSTSTVVARFYPEGIPAGVPYNIGWPFFTPSSELVFIEEYGTPSVENYKLVAGNLVTGEQRVVAELGSEPHRPLGWAADGVTLLTTREPDFYDTWQVDIVTGDVQQIAAWMFLGYIQEPPPGP